MNAPLQVFGAFGHGGAVLAGLGIGVAFGWFLERGGLGDAPKLAGQFYLTDLTVFKMLFTGLVTAMLGVYWLARAGVLDPRLLDVSHTYLAPMAVGGAVFGLGFILGGLCPGTSCVSASSGRIDGLLVMVGMFVGVLAFMELHPLLEAFHNASDLGVATFPSLIGAPPGPVVAGVTVAALSAFVVAERIAPHASRGWSRRALLGGGLALGLVAAVPLPGGVEWAGQTATGGRVGSLELARAIRRGETDVRVLDIRSAAAFDDFHLPLAESVPFERLGRVDLEPGRRVVVYGFRSEDGERARVLLHRRGLERVEALEGGVAGWLHEVMLPTLARDAGEAERRRFEEVADLSRYFGGTPSVSSAAAPGGLDVDEILRQARRASCGW